ncbi:MAG: c-type cytochrome biogenesis protein CcmI [Rhodobacterales bacterium]|nr:c-type cytochrome biogenesis protein CcmI [Rhodobacterales bacterium]
MAVWIFWTVALLIAAGVAAVLTASLWQGRPVPTDNVEEGRAQSPDLAVYKDQLAEIARDETRGTIAPEEAQRLRAEVGRRVLEVDRVLAAASESGAAPAQSGVARLTAAIVLAAVLPGAAAVYWWLGAPGYPDMPLRPRLAGLDAALADRPTQTEELARIGKPRDAALDGTLAVELDAISDPEALRRAFRTRFEAGEVQAALRTQERLLAVVGEAAGTTDHANLALALVLEAGGYVSPEAETQLRLALTLDLTNELARYLVGEMFLQGGRFDQTFRFWRPLLESGSPDAPWMASIRDRIGMVADLAGIPYDVPDATGTGLAGPSADDVAAASDMTPEDRQAMIEGMVAQLSERLASEGGDVEDWNRLIRSLAVLERLPEAQSIYDEAKVRFEGRPAELSFLRLAAVETGLSP